MLRAQFLRRAACSLVLAACSALAGCGGGQESRAQPSETASEAIRVVTAPVVRKPLGVEIEAVGTAQANESVEVTSKISNTVTAIRFNEGDLVRRGAVLVELDAAAARAALEEAEAALAESQNNYQRSRDLYTSRALSESQLDQIEATLKGNRARVAAARAQVADTIIRATFDGRTGFRRVSVGSLVSPGTVITTLDDTSVIKLDFTVPETHLYLLERGLPVTALASGLPGRTFEGEVTNLDSRIDPVTRSIRVRAEIPNEDGALRPGMFMTVSLQGQVAPTLIVQEAAIVPEQGRTFVFVVRDDVVERREVKLGKRRPGEVEIREGLDEHERVVVEGTQKVRHGARVVEFDRRAGAPSS